MDEDSGLIDLQKRQYQHDKEHHQDIFNTSYPDRMNHYTLHFSKYTGRLSQEYPSKNEITGDMEKTLADGFIVALASANTLNIDLYQEIQDRHDINTEETDKVSAKLKEEHNVNDIGDVEESREWLFTQLAVPAGRMANAMESLDHMEPMAVREILEEKTVDIAEYLLVASELIDVDIKDILHDRWDKIEKNSIL